MLLTWSTDKLEPWFEITIFVLGKDVLMRSFWLTKDVEGWGTQADAISEDELDSCYSNAAKEVFSLYFKLSLFCGSLKSEG